jgi:hypothetical protein
LPVAKKPSSKEPQSTTQKRKRQLETEVLQQEAATFTVAKRRIASQPSQHIVVHHGYQLQLSASLQSVQYPTMFSLPVVDNQQKMIVDNFDAIINNYDSTRLSLLFQVNNPPTSISEEICMLLLMEFILVRDVTDFGRNKKAKIFSHIPLQRLWHKKLREIHPTYQRFVAESNIQDCHEWTDLEIWQHIKAVTRSSDRSFYYNYELRDLIFDDDDDMLGMEDDGLPQSDEEDWELCRDEGRMDDDDTVDHLGNSDDELTLHDFLTEKDYHAYINGYGESTEAEIPQSINLPLQEYERLNELQEDDDSVVPDEMIPSKLHHKIADIKDDRLESQDITNYHDESEAVPVVNPDLVRTEKELWEKYGNKKISSFKPAQRSMNKALQELLEDWKPFNPAIKNPSCMKELRQFKHKAIHFLIKNKMKTEEEAIALVNKYIIQWKSHQGKVQEEAFVNQHQSIDGLRYLPPEEGDRYMGSFVGRLTPYGTEVFLTREWVKQNFEEDVVHSVVNQGLASENKFFVQVSASQEPLTYDNIQITSLKADCMIYTAEHDFPLIRFKGLLADRRVVDLEDDYITTNFEEEFIEQVIREGLQARNRFVHLPPGAAMEKPEEHDFDFLNIPIKYKQEESSCCLFLSLASALHFAGFEDTARILATEAPKYGADSQAGVFNWTELLSIMEKKIKFLQPFALSSIVNLLDNTSDYVTVATLMSSEGSVQHAIAIIRNIVFDANCDFAMPLCQEVLDYCCSTAREKVSYHHLYHGYRFQEQPGDKRQRWKKNLNKSLP